MEANDPALIKEVFESMDQDNTGQIGAVELQSGLSNGTDKPFNIKTCRLMVAMFDKKNTHMLNFEDFTNLWTFVNMWVKAFETYDTNGSGKISKVELNKLFSTVGYSFSEKMYSFLAEKFGQKEEEEGIVFDDFLFICINLHMLTGVFSNLDKHRTGEIELSYDTFVETVFDVNTY